MKTQAPGLEVVDPSMTRMREPTFQGQPDPVPRTYNKQECRNDEETTTPLRSMAKTLLVAKVGDIDTKQEGDDDCVGYPYNPTNMAGVFRSRPDEVDHSSNRSCITPSIHGEQVLALETIFEVRPETEDFQSKKSTDTKNIETKFEPPSLIHRVSTSSGTTTPPLSTEKNYASCLIKSTQDASKARSPVSVIHMTDLHHGEAFASPPLLPSLPVLPPSSTITSTASSPSPSRKRSLASMSSMTLGSNSTTESTLAPRWQEMKRPKTDDSPGATAESHTAAVKEQAQKAPMKLEEDQNSPKDLLSSHSTDGSDKHHPSLLEIAVGYGFHLARVRLMHEQNNCELSGILDPSRKVQDILEDGAETVLRMKDEERMLFWKYMNQSPPLQEQLKNKTTRMDTRQSRQSS